MRVVGFALLVSVFVVACSGAPPSGLLSDAPDAASVNDAAVDAVETQHDAAPPVEACATTCGGQCTDTTSDVANCGACGNVCGTNHLPLVGGVWSCKQSQCAVTCPSALSACEDGCHDLSAETDHCGTCNHACSLSDSCCGGSCADTLTDNANCGQCGAQCSGTCSLGSCCQKPTSGSCSHPPCTSGYPLPSTCDGQQGCVAKVCASDPYCCTSSWDSTCVSEVATYCAPLQCKC